MPGLSSAQIPDRGAITHEVAHLLGGATSKNYADSKRGKKMAAGVKKAEIAPRAEIKENVDPLDLLDREDLVKTLRAMQGNGVALTFHGKRTAMEIAKRVRPRVTRRITEFHVGTPEEQSRNTLIEGENLQALATLYKYRGQVDLVLTDPPYNTGNDFRYNDRWDEDPNDPDLGPFVPLEDGARHTKWMRFMWPRLQMMKAMLKPSGVLAICIDYRELFRLGQMLDELFGEENRLGIINWQKSAAPRPDNNHVSTSTEYVLVYANDLGLARTLRLQRGEGDNRRYSNPDNDPDGDWREGNLTAKSYSQKDDYGIQSPFTGEVHYPAGSGAWRHPKRNVIAWLSEWGTPYEERDIGDGRQKALMFKGGKPKVKSAPVSAKATARMQKPNWPFVWFGRDGRGRPRVKTHLELIRKGKVPVTYWADEEFGFPVEIDSTSWDYEESGRSSDGVSELTSLVGEGHNFTTVKPLKLFSKIIQIWCGSDGLVLDPFAGSGTTGHANLELNARDGGTRQFILIEQGAPENADKYARTLTQLRLRNAILGIRPGGKRVDPLGGGFEFRMLTSQIDAKAVLSMKKEELIDVVITSHWEMGRRNSPTLIRMDDPRYYYLVGRNERGEGYFIIWNNGGPVGQLDRDSYRLVLKDAEKAGLKPPYQVYARYEVYQSRNVNFWKIPDKILAHLGLNENSDRFNEAEVTA
jgi:adenine-specific DNA-methyltransferase